MIRSILVPLDGSAFGEHALPLAAWIARRAPAALQVVHVHQCIPPSTVAGVVVMDDLEITLRREERAYLDGVVRRLEDEATVPATAALLEGDVAQAVQTRAVAAGVDLVVLSTHGRGALGRFWLGSVADELVRHLPMPVLLARPGEGPANLGSPPPLKQILLPLDGTPLAEQMIEPALTLGGLMGAAFTLLRVVKPAVRINYLPEGSTLEGMTDNYLERIHAQQKQLHDEAQGYLDGVAARLRSRAVGVEARVVVEEQPAVGILRQARAHGADLIAMETHGRRGLSRLLLGSVADKVVRGGTLPVLLHRPVQV
jgi:nucleotide-binding universal stress UspA family protein